MGTLADIDPDTERATREDEWEHPERFSNPALIENIRREGVRL